ncbi:inositol monophosphatase [Poseidonocella sp. HB161398]|uniref:inositol monophosphatase family protein n=1 Tax=Poseidonocella sp. HB161398 TaxID=2320855 RepID=UPI001107E950|nr:inositol monophosphatase [Poseidonocella sp. HB161398]
MPAVTGTLAADEAEALTALVRDTARRLILPRFRNLDATEIAAKSDPLDLVTVADREAEAAIAQGARRILPGAAIIGEEAVAADPRLLDALGQGGTAVLIDPVDGTLNFARGLSVFGVILAVVREGQTVFGLLHDPVMDDWVVAHRGGGAWHVSARGARRRLKVSDCRALGEAEGILPFETGHGTRRAQAMAAFAGARSLRSLRCSCHEYRMLAAGQADFSVSALLNPWDHAAGMLAVEEAGGWGQVEGGRRYVPTLRDGRAVAAAGPELGRAVAALAWRDSV